MEELEKLQPGYQQQIAKGFRMFQKQKKSQERITITIPIHVIVVHPTGQPIGSGVNFSLEHVQSQIDVLNQDFGRYNSDAGNTPPVFPAADTGIQFCLATVDPDGNPTDGITRYAFDGSFPNNAYAIRQATQWSRDSYCNIWTAPNLPYLGVASLPSTFAPPPEDQDFIHVDAGTFGGPGYATTPNYNLGRTTTHEMGHWLGLLHVWGPGNGSCGVDDNINDTPLQQNSNFGCPNHPSPSCGNSGDMFMNYMDYVNDNCMNAFTQEQGDYMNTILSTSRASLNGSSFTACAASIPLELNVVSQEDPGCTDSSDGIILVEATGGVPDYSYSIDGGAPSSNNLFTDLPGGTYFIEVTDSDGNSDDVTVFLNTPLPLSANVMVITENNCPTDTNAVVEIQVSGGNNPYTYALDMGMTQMDNTFENLANGFYVVNIVDDNGCTLDVDFEITSGSEISITLDSISNLICSNDNMGLIEVSAEGGNGPLSYSIDGFNFQENGIFTDLDGGDYIVYVQDTVGCYDSLIVDIAEPDPFFISVQSTDASCYGLNDGFVDVVAFGGNGGPYQYSFDSLTFGDTTILDSLFAGDYDIFALDSLGCLAMATFDIDEPEEIMLFADTIVNASCANSTDGSMSLFATGGNGGYTYIFQGDSTSTAVYDQLTPGMYDVFVVDMNGCEGSATFTVGISGDLEIAVDTSTPPSCAGNMDGSILISASGGTGEYSYSINGGPLQDSPLFENLGAGSYTIDVFDELGCSASIDLTLEAPEALSILTETVDITCYGANDGMAVSTMTGGTPPIIFTYSPTDPGPTGFGPGDYVVTATDANGCTITEEFTIIEPEALMVDQMVFSPDPDKVTVFASGGTKPYLYSFDEGATFTDNNVTEDLASGTIIVIVKDANDCVVEAITFVDNVNDLTQDWGIKSYPNPFQQVLTLEMEFPSQVNAAIEVFDMSGQQVYYISARNYNSGKNFVKIDLSNFASSIYIVKIALAEGYHYIKATKM